MSEAERTEEDQDGDENAEIEAENASPVTLESEAGGAVEEVEDQQEAEEKEDGPNNASVDLSTDLLQYDDDEVGGAAVGTLDHIFKRTFREFYDSEEEEEEEEVEGTVVCEENDECEKARPETEEEKNDGEAEEEKIDEHSEVERSSTELEEEKDNEEMADDASITEEEPQTEEEPKRGGDEGELVKDEHAEHESRYVEEVSRIDAMLEEINSQADALESHLERSRIEAVEEDEREKDRLYKQGLLIKSEYPQGRSYLKMDKEMLGEFGVLGSSLLISKDLILENENERLYRIGQAKKKTRDFTLRPSTPNYLKGVIKKKEGKQRVKKKITQQKKKPEINSDDRHANEKVLDRMKKQINFLKNPRFKDGYNRKRDWKASVLNRDSTEPKIQSELTSSPIFRVTPEVAVFNEYKVGEVYDTTLKIHNTKSVSQRVRILPPTSKYFAMTLAVYPSNTGTLAPGMACVVKIMFSPDSLGEYSDFLTIITENKKYRVPIKAKRTPPCLSLPDVLNIGCCLTGNESTVSFRCSNSGGPGKFRIFPAPEDLSQFEIAEGVNHDITEYFSKQNLSFAVDLSPFSIHPREFALANKEETKVTVNFSPERNGKMFYNNNRELFTNTNHSGEIERKFLLVCDNCQIKTFTVKGTSCNVTLDVYALDETVIDTKNPLTVQPKSVIFKPTITDAMLERQISIKNSTPINLPFHWSLFAYDGTGGTKSKKSKSRRASKLTPVHLLQNFVDIFKIEPSSGTFPPDGCLKFIVKFQPNKSSLFRFHLQLIIEDIPPSSVIGFEPHLSKSGKKREQSTQNESNNGEDGTDLETNRTGGSQSKIQLMNIPCMKLDLLGAGQDPVLVATPSVLSFGGNMLVTKTYKLQISLTNPCEIPLSYNWGRAVAVLDVRRRQETGDGFHSDYTSQPKPLAGIVAKVEPSFGLVAPAETIVSEVHVTCQSSGAISFSIPCNYNSSDSNTLTTSVRVIGSVVGPIVEFTNPEVDFGLVGVNEVAEFKVGVSNTTDIPASVSFKTCQTLCDFSLNDNNSSLLKEEIMNTADLDDVASIQDESDISTLAFKPETCLVGPREKIFVTLQCSAGSKPERLRKTVECQVENSISSYINVRAEIQSPKVYIESEELLAGNGTFELGTTYVTVPVTRTIKIVNMSNLLGKFKWSEVSLNPNTDKYDATFSEAAGVLGPKEHREIQFKYVAKKAGRVSTLFACTIEGMQYPVGFALKTSSKGLTVSYSIVPKEEMLENDKSVQNVADENDEKAATTKIPILDFGNDLPLCQRKTLHLRVTNHSAIPTTYNMSLKSFGAQCVPPSLCTASRASIRSSRKELSSSQTSFTRLSSQKSSRSKFTTKGNKELKMMLGESHEVTDVYKSEDGSKYIIAKIQAAEDRDVLANGGGVAFLAHPREGVLKPWQSIIVDIVCFNNMPGRYKSELVCNVEGLPPTKIPIKVKVVGSPLELSQNTVGLDMKQKVPTLNFSSNLVGTKCIHKIVKIVNNGPVDNIVNWCLKAKRPADSDMVVINLSFNENGLRSEANADLVNATILPHPDLSTPPPFEVRPYQQRVPANGSASFRVTYSPSTDKETEDGAVMVADGDWVDPNADDVVSMKLVNSKATLSTVSTRESLSNSASLDSMTSAGSGADKTKRESMRGFLTVDLMASSLRPALELDRAVREDGLKRVLFSVWSIHEPRSHSTFYKTITFTNSGGMALNCQLDIAPPFEVSSVKNTDTTTKLFQDSSEAGNESYRLPRGEKLAIKIRFSPPGMRKLKAEEKLDINNLLQQTSQGCLSLRFDNGDTERVRLEGTLLKPTVESYPAQYDFGRMHVESQGKIELMLGNTTVVPAHWKLEHIPAPEESEEIDDPTCWIFEKTEGILNGPTLPLSIENYSLPQGLDEGGKRKPISVPVKFSPKAHGMYKSRFRFKVRKGVPFDVVLEGEGSYEETNDYSVKRLLAPKANDE